MMEWRQCGLVWNVVQRSRWSRTTKFSYLVTKAGRRELEGREAVAGGREGGRVVNVWTSWETDSCRALGASSADQRQVKALETDKFRDGALK